MNKLNNRRRRNCESLRSRAGIALLFVLIFAARGGWNSSDEEEPPLEEHTEKKFVEARMKQPLTDELLFVSNMRRDVT